MKKYRVMAVLITAIVLMLSFTTVAYAADPSGETSDTTSSTTSGISTSAGTSDASAPAGTGTVIDSGTDGSGKEFLTIMTPDKHVFYLIIDRDQKSNNVYFLDTVTEKDLLSLAEQSGDTGSSKSSVSGSTSNKTSETAPPASGSKEGTSGKSSAPKQSNNIGMLFVVLAIVLIGGGAGYYFKIYRPKHQQADAEDEDDYSAKDEADPHEAQDTEQADDLPPWEDEDDNAGESEDGKE